MQGANERRERFGGPKHEGHGSIPLVAPSCLVTAINFSARCGVVGDVFQCSYVEELLVNEKILKMKPSEF